ncbi:hypothetical protein BJV74DRAFT_841560 [Russula compacta]|nr:hypothetical protein BJV74DRAFT_841560 [Russula compacta]
MLPTNKECVYHYRLQDINNTAILGPTYSRKKKRKKEMGARKKSQVVGWWYKRNRSAARIQTKGRCVGHYVSALKAKTGNCERNKTFEGGGGEDERFVRGMWMGGGVCCGLKGARIRKRLRPIPSAERKAYGEEVIRMDSGSVKHRLRDDAVSPTVAPAGIDGSRGGRLGLGDGGGGGGGEERGEGIHLVSV